MTDSEKLKKRISESGVSISFIARKIGILREELYKKLNNETGFKVSEISCIKEVLGLSNCE